jgi:hypothetical protein
MNWITPRFAFQARMPSSGPGPRFTRIYRGVQRMILRTLLTPLYKIELTVEHSVVGFN